jgi:hypothetical protein
MFNAKSKTNASHTHTRGRKQERERERRGRGEEKKGNNPRQKKTQCQEEGLQQVQQRKGTKKDKEWGGKEKLTVNNTLS